MDVYVFKRSTSRGKYNQMMDPDGKRDASAAQQSPWSTNIEETYTEQKPFRDEPVPKAQKNAGYAVPDEQYTYDDTGYYGAHSNGMNRRNEGPLL